MILQRWGLWLAFSACFGVLAGCGGAGTSSLLPGNSGSAGSDAASAQAKAAFVISIPPKKHGRGARYVSASTRSISIALESTPGGPAVRTIKKNLTASSPGCVSGGGGTTCTIIVVLKPGTFTAVVDTYDALSQHGKILSEGQSVPLKIVAKKSNKIALILGGVPHELKISGGTRTIHGSQAAGFTIYGTGAQPVIVTAKDADGNTIVGADSLHYSASVASGSGWSVQATPNPATPNTFAITPPGTNGAAASIKMTFKYSSGACSQAGATCTATFAAKNDVQLLAVIDCGVSCSFSSDPDAVLVYKLPNITTPIAKVTNQVLNPLTVAFGPDGTLFVANCRSSQCFAGGPAESDTVTVYAPPYTGTPKIVSNNVFWPTLMAVNSAGDLVVEDCFSCNFMGPDFAQLYKTGTYAIGPTLIAKGQINALSAGPAGDFFMADCVKFCGYVGSDEVLQFTKTSAFASSDTITNSIADPTALAFDDGGLLYVADCQTCSTIPTYDVTKYVAPYSGASDPIGAIVGSGTAGMPPYVYQEMSLATDSSGNIFVGNAPGVQTYQDVAEFLAPAFSGDGTLLLSGYQPFELRMDGLNDLIESSGDTVEFVPPPYTTQEHVIELGPSTNQPFAISP